MNKQRMVNTKFWDDKYIIKLKPLEKYLFLYFITNPLTNISGVYEVSLNRISLDTGLTFEEIELILNKFREDKKMFYEDGIIAIVNFIKNQNYNSPKIQKAISDELTIIPNSLKDTLCIPYRYGMDTVSQVIKDNIIKDKGFLPLKNTTVGQRRFFRDMEMRESQGKWWCIPKDKGKWLEFDMRFFNETELK